MFEISINEILESLRAENPWWAEKAVGRRYANLPRRAYYGQFFSLIVEKSIRRAVVLMGPRRVGKTVMMQQSIQGLIDKGVDPTRILYVSVDTPTYTGMGLERLVKLFAESNAVGKDDDIYVFFDEIQYLKDWEAHLKSLVDRHFNAQFVASGSAAAALKRASRESGAGRFTDFTLPPLTFAEYLDFIGREDDLIVAVPGDDGQYVHGCPDIEELNEEFINYLNYGGYPEAVFSGVARSERARYIKSDIIDKVLLRDLPSLYGISDIQELNRLFTSMAYSTGSAISLEKLSQSSGVSKPTITRYIEYLEAAFLVCRIKRIDEGCATFAREREFKAYLTNPSMRAALFHPIRDDSEAIGHVVETAVFSQFFHWSEISELYYARWKLAGRKKASADMFGEVDVVHVPPGTGRPIFALEIKWSDRFFEKPEEVDGLIDFCRKNSLRSAHVTTRTKIGTKHIGGIELNFSPCALWCYSIGKGKVDLLREDRPQ